MSGPVRWLGSCGNGTEHAPHAGCVGIPLPPIDEQFGPGVAEALDAVVRRQLAWTENDPAGDGAA